MNQGSFDIQLQDERRAGLHMDTQVCVIWNVLNIRADSIVQPL